MVNAEVFAALPVSVTVPVLTVRAVVRVAPVTVAALPVQEAEEPEVFWFKVGNVQLVKVPEAGVPKAIPEPKLVNEDPVTLDDKVVPVRELAGKDPIVISVNVRAVDPSVIAPDVVFNQNVPVLVVP